MSAKQWSKALKEAVDRGEEVREAVTDKVVEYKPRHRFDPQPWTDGFFRYTGRECYAYPIDKE